jgi:hypothetical protein
VHCLAQALLLRSAVSQGVWKKLKADLRAFKGEGALASCLFVFLQGLKVLKVLQDAERRLEAWQLCKTELFDAERRLEAWQLLKN